MLRGSFLPAVLVPSVLALFSGPAWARPEYALREKMSCVACHVTPWGGGHRTVLGKSYGSHGHEPGPTAANDLFYGDLRAIAYFPFERVTERVHGFEIMETAASANVPLSRKDASPDVRALVTYDLAPLSGHGYLRDAYVRLKFASEDPSTGDFITLGRFYVPFGLLTDEHRTYTRIQTNSRINDYRFGVAYSRDFRRGFRSDLALVHRLQGGSGLTSGDVNWAGVLNLRWNPPALPFLVGASGEYQYSSAQPEPAAVSGYAGLSLDRVTGGKLHGAVLFESVYAVNWNNPALNTGESNPGLFEFFQPVAVGKNSLGNYLWFRYDVSSRWSLLYKFDYLALETDKLGANYTRHGIGAEFYPGPGFVLNARVELASEPKGLEGSDALAVQDAYFLMARVSL